MTPKGLRGVVLVLLWAVAAASVIVGVLWGLPIVLTERPRLDGFDRHQAINGARTGVAAVLAASGAVAGLAYTARTFRLAGQGQIADRYTRAVEQLGSDKASVRIGAVHSLARTVGDAEGYRREVASLLVAFVRDRSAGTDDARTQRGRKWQRASRAVPAPETDVAEALRVLRDLARDHPEIRALDLRHAQLAGHDLVQMNLVDANLVGTDLRNAKLHAANLEGADLREADLRGAVVYQSRMKNARVTRGAMTAQQLQQASDRSEIQWNAPLAGAT